MLHEGISGKANGRNAYTASGFRTIIYISARSRLLNQGLSLHSLPVIKTQKRPG